MKLFLLSTILTAYASAQMAPPCPPICRSGGNGQSLKKANSQKPQPAAAAKAKSKR